MAFTAAPSHTFLLGIPTTTTTRRRAATRRRKSTSHVSLHVSASQVPSNRERPPPGVDTRIHWENDDEGWIGGSSAGTGSSKSQQAQAEQEQQQNNVWGDKFADLLNDSIYGSHYQFLGVSAEADLEEIKAAYRRLSKEYHPDTTSLPLKTASDKFLRLREIYNVLSNEETRNFYNWTLAQEAASRQAEQMRMKLEDPYVKAVERYEPVPDMVDRLGGKNMPIGNRVAMDSVRGQGGIQMLLTAEQEAQHIVNTARNSKMARLRQAKEEADREVQQYRTKMEAEYQQKLSDTSGSSGSNVKRLEEETEVKIKSLKESSSKVQSENIGMLLKYVTNVKT